MGVRERADDHPSPPATDQAFFDAMYRRAEDPWDFATSDYEQERYRATLAMLDDAPYGAAFEPGCSVGVLTAMLAPRCTSLVAIDISPIAVERARARCREFANVDVRTGRLPDDVPPGSLDLVVLSEVGYYFTVPQLADIISGLVERMADGALLVAVHWTGLSPNHVLTGAEVHAVLDRERSLDATSSTAHPGYLLAGYHRRARSARGSVRLRIGSTDATNGTPR